MAEYKYEKQTTVPVTRIAERRRCLMPIDDVPSTRHDRMIKGG